MSEIEEFWTKAEKLAAQEYAVETSEETLTNGDVVILVKHPELPGCMSHGTTYKEALANLRDARIEYIYSLLVDELPVPNPRTFTTSTTVLRDHVEFDEIKIVGFNANVVSEPETEEEDTSRSMSWQFVS